MRCSVKGFLLNSCLAMTAVGVASTAAHAAQPLTTESGFVVNLVDVRDLEPLMSQKAGPTVATSRAADRLARPAAPVEMAAIRTRDASDLFSNSRAVLPLLVGDLEAQTVSYAALRPMSGSSVGARPSLPWSKPTASR